MNNQKITFAMIGIIGLIAACIAKVSRLCKRPRDVNKDHRHVGRQQGS